MGLFSLCFCVSPASFSLLSPPPPEDHASTPPEVHPDPGLTQDRVRAGRDAGDKAGPSVMPAGTRLGSQPHGYVCFSHLPRPAAPFKLGSLDLRAKAVCSLISWGSFYPLAIARLISSLIFWSPLYRGVNPCPPCVDPETSDPRSPHSTVTLSPPHPAPHLLK